MDDRLAEEYAQEVLKSVHEHFSILDQVLPRPIQVAMGEITLTINPLIVGISSRYLRDLIRKECYEKHKKILSFAVNDPHLAMSLLKYMETGNIDDLWKWHEQELIALAELTDQWDLKKLSDECQRVLCRYISKENVIERLISAQQLQKSILRDKCFLVFNASFKCAEIYPVVPEGLGFEFKNFLDEAMWVFDRLKGSITHLSFNEKLDDEDKIKKIVNQCSHLIGLNISSGDVWSRLFQCIPAQVQELNMARTEWLNDKVFRQLAEYAPQIKAMNLSENIQLTYLGFGDLRLFRDLEQLNLSNCNQLGESELSIVLQSAPHLVNLNVFGCKKLSDLAFYDLARYAKLLEVLDVSRTAILDGALIEIGHRCLKMRVMSLDHCLSISDWGLREFLKYAKNVIQISLKESLISEDTLTFIRKQYPLVDIKL